ncbi:T6SS effector BTH_I2691 family protein [Litchfieldella rifensis]|uniref:T6SS effector BTH_I2691 family protein n=1 Tax=Litchfieldella rifensis TaxID=762643 RepID=A0ABV7LTF8_9GAMM
MSDIQALREARDAEFEEVPLGSAAMCPLLRDIAIFPVRYAIDESPAQAGEPGPHPLPEAWNGPAYPKLKTRDYTLRQLRDGWLYVWSEETRDIDEYRVEGCVFTGEGGDTKHYLLYPSAARLAIVYSSVQWTERIRDMMRDNADARARLMRVVDPMAAFDGLVTSALDSSAPLPSHIGPLTSLGESVADMLPDGATGEFTSTTVATRPHEQDGDGADESVYEVLGHKPEIHQNKILSKVPSKDEAIFVALDDDLGIVNDLTMSLLGREQELEQFNDEHGHRLETARVVEQLCGPDESRLPKAIREDAEARRQAMHTLHRRHIAQGEYEALQAQDDYLATRTGAHLPSVEGVGWLSERRELDAALQEMGIDPPGEEAYEAWKNKGIWRNDVRYDDAMVFVQEKEPELEHLQAHVAASLEDLTAWLERLPLEAEDLCFDTCDLQQSQGLIEFAHLVAQVVGATASGQKWLEGTFRERDSLIGLALVNFNSALGNAIETIARNFYETGSADGQPEGGVEVGDIANVASRYNEIIAVLGLEHVQQSARYQALATPVQEAFETLRRVVAGSAKGAWEALAFQALPAMGAGAQASTDKIARGLMQSLVVALVHPDVERAYLVRRGDFEAGHAQWLDDMMTHKLQLEAARQALAQEATAGERNAQMNRLRELEQQYQALALEEPKRIVAGESGGDPSNTGTQVRVSHLETLGYAELKQQHRLRLERLTQNAHQRMKTWMERRGGGLALLIAGLNLVNIADSVVTASREGMSQADLEKIASQAGYTASAVMALWVMPYWNRAASGRFRLNGQPKALAEVSFRAWKRGGKLAAARLAARLASAVVGMAAFAAIGAGVETWQVVQQHGRATSGEEQAALTAKGIATLSMTLTGAAQLIGAIAGRWVAFAWVLAPWATWTLAIAGVVYLFASMIADYYHREGVRLWLYRSTWGKASQWSDSDEDQAAEMRTLTEALLAPSLKLIPVRRSTRRGSRGQLGYWIQLALPAALGGEAIQVSDNARRGFWAPVDSIDESLRRSRTTTPSLSAAAQYRADDPLRVWQAWLPAEEQGSDNPFTLTVDYAYTLLANPQGRADFTFYKPKAGDGKYAIEANTELRGGKAGGFTLAVPGAT